jgi:HPt (histidine-containing phosphotransfer) domain-containing protein
VADFETSALIRQLRASYLQSLVGKMAEFSDAAAAPNFKTIVRIGHQLKGSGRSYGIPEVSDLGARIEEAGENRRIALFEPLLAEFTEIMKHLTDDQQATEKM